VAVRVGLYVTRSGVFSSGRNKLLLPPVSCSSVCENRRKFGENMHSEQVAIIPRALDLGPLAS